MSATRDIEEIRVEPLSAEAAQGFGKALLFGATHPTSDGGWWKCWEGCAELSQGRQWVGFVQAGDSMPDITEMEREPGTELIIPVSGEIVQCVAHGVQDASGIERPDGRTARAFVVKPGSALAMNAGVWHAAAFGLKGEASYFYIAQRRKAEDSEGRGGWVELLGRLILRPRADQMVPHMAAGDRDD
ncbi:ureidoglycolate lyase [Rhizobiales bacterium 3FA27D7]|jgi:ureidoglycolate hydrolase|uniref:ureidoglycolate lyase n=1 Tax=Mesorhizobium sp. 2RAF21 TaxID=3232995 RepID=UPI0010F64BD2